MRKIELARGAWGAALLLSPRPVLGGVLRLRVDRANVNVARILGARHLTQAVLSGATPSREVLALGVWVDGVHALTALGLAGLDPTRARAGLIDAAVAATWAGFGLRDVETSVVAGAGHDRLRDQLARGLLSRLPGAGLLPRTPG